MNSRAQSLRAWRRARHDIALSGMVTIPKTSAFPHPRDAGAVPTATWPVGQIADYVLEMEFGLPPLLIREFTDRFEAVVAGITLTQQVIQLAEANPAVAIYIGGMLLGGAIGTAIAGNRKGAYLGAGLGLLAAVMLRSHLERSSRESVTIAS